jgi:hypothetical protein
LNDLLSRQKAVVCGDGGPAQEVSTMVKGLPDATGVVFDDERVVANAGVVLPAVLAVASGSRH